MLSTVCVCGWANISVWSFGLVLEKCKIPRRRSALCLITAVTQPSVAQKVILSASLSVILILVLFANSELSLNVWRTSSGVPHSWSMSMHVQLCIYPFYQLSKIPINKIYLFMFQILTSKRAATGGGLLVLDGCRRWWGEESLPWDFSATAPPHTCPVSCVHSSHNTHSLGFLPRCCFTVSYTLFCKNLYFVLTVVDCISVIESLYPEPCLLSMLLACVCWCQKNVKMIGDRNLVFSITSFNVECKLKYHYTWCPLPALQIWSM